MRNDVSPEPRLWKGSLAGAGAAAFFGLEVAIQGASVLGALLAAGVWGSLVFFAVAGSGFRPSRNVSAGMRRLSRSERKTFRRSWRAGVLPDEPSVRTVAVAYAAWLADPVPLQKVQLWVMGAWVAVACVGTFAALLSEDWGSVGRWAAVGGLPALAFGGTVFRIRFGQRARRLLALNVIGERGADPTPLSP